MRKVEDILEFNIIKEKVSKYSNVKKAKEFINDLKMFKDYHELKDELALVDEAMQVIKAFGGVPTHGFFDLSENIELCKVGYIIDIEGLYQFARNAELVNGIIKFKEEMPKLNIPHLDDLFYQLTPLSSLKKKIDDCISPSLEIYDNASSELKRVRREIKELENEVNIRLKSFLRNNKDYLNENIITYRNDRIVVPVKSSYKYNIAGVIVEESTSGQTAFVEPEFVFKINLEIYKLKQIEHEEINKILKRLTKDVFDVLYEIELNEKIVARLDFVFAKGLYGDEIDGSISTLIPSSSHLVFHKALHPLLDKSKGVRNDVEITDDNALIILSGPNAGGKSVYLKMVGLLAYMALSALPIPVLGKNEISLLDGIYVDIGDDQSISNSLSTFSSHIKKLNYILTKSTSHSLILVDEIGSGTDPKEGESISMAVLDELVKRNIKGIVTTHYSALKTYAVSKDNVINYSMLFDEENLTPLYKVNKGASGKSYAYEILTKMGISQNIIDNAKHYEKLNSSQDEILIKKLEEDLKNIEFKNLQVEEKLKEVNELKEKTDKENRRLAKVIEEIDNRAEEKIEDKIADALKEIDSIVDEIKNTERENLKLNKWVAAKKKIVSLRKEEVEEVENDNHIYQVHDLVLIKKLNKQGEVISINGDNLLVISNGMKFNLKLNNVKYLGKKEIEKNTSKVKVQVKSELKHVNYELNVIGLTREEAMREVISHLDDAKLVHLKQVRIVHGFGSGVLRRAIHEYLTKEGYEYRLGGSGEGGGGATIVSL